MSIALGLLKGPTAKTNKEVLVLVEQVLVVPVEVLARAVLPAQAAAVRALLPIRRPILQARPGAAAPILRQAIQTPEVWTPTPML